MDYEFLPIVEELFIIYNSQERHSHYFTRRGIYVFMYCRWNDFIKWATLACSRMFSEKTTNLVNSQVLKNKNRGDKIIRCGTVEDALTK